MSYTRLNYHVVFSTKDRRPYMGDDLTARLIKYIGGIARELKGALLEANGPADHLHLVVQIPSTMAVADFIRELKTNSSKWVHGVFANQKMFAWQDGYSAFTVSHSGLPEVIRYVQTQMDHHKKMSFQEELSALLKRHEIPYDERYILG